MPTIPSAGAYVITVPQAQRILAAVGFELALGRNATGAEADQWLYDLIRSRVLAAETSASHQAVAPPVDLGAHT